MTQFKFKQWLCEQESHVYIPSGGLGVPRDKMPQVNAKDVPEYLSWLQEQHGVRSARERVRVSDLKPTQGEINTKKVSAMFGTGMETLGKPVIVSQDNYILDGHHRWLAILHADPNCNLDCYRVYTDMGHLLELTRHFPKAWSAGINYGAPA